MSVERKLYFETKDGERFYDDHYNDVRIIVREKDGYVNVTKMGNDNGKEFKALLRNQEWTNIIDKFSSLWVGRILPHL